MASKLTMIKTQAEKGAYNLLVTGDTICGSKIMSLIMAWTAYNQDGDDLRMVAGVNGGQGRGGDIVNSSRNGAFMQFVLTLGTPVLVELIEASNKMKVWPLFELACNSMANLIKDQDVAGVRQLLQSGNGAILSTGFINGVIKYLPISKRQELDNIELKECQLASVCGSQRNDYDTMQLSTRAYETLKKIHND